MELIQEAAPSMQDLGIYDVEDWSKGFNSLYKELFSTMFDKDLKLHDALIPVMEELENESFCGADGETLARSLARVVGVLTFIKMATNRNP
jgi:hypothetical protein